MKLTLKYFFIIGDLFLSVFCFAQNRMIDSLEGLLKKDKADTIRVIHLSSLSRYYELSGDFEKGSWRGKEALALATKLNYREGMARAANNLGNNLRALGNYPEAFTVYFKSLKLYEELGDRKNMSGPYNNIGLIYRVQKNYADALKYYFLSLEIKKEMGDKKGLSSSYNNIGNVYFYEGKYDEAIDYFSKALALRKELGDKQGIAASFINIGNIFYRQLNFQEALKNYLETLKISEELKDKSGIASALVNLGSTEMELHHLPQAKKYINRALALSLEIGNKTEILSSYSCLAELDSAGGNYDGALENYKMSVLFRDSLLNEENTKKTVRSEMQYDFDKKQTADSISNAEHAKQETLKHDQEIKQQKIYTYGGAFGFLLMFIVAGVSFRAFKQKQKANTIISEQKNLVDEKQKEILDSIHYAKRIQRSLLPTEKYIERNFRRLKKN